MPEHHKPRNRFQNHQHAGSKPRRLLRGDTCHAELRLWGRAILPVPGAITRVMKPGEITGVPSIMMSPTAPTFHDNDHSSCVTCMTTSKGAEGNQVPRSIASRRGREAKPRRASAGLELWVSFNIGSTSWPFHFFKKNLWCRKLQGHGRVH